MSFRKLKRSYILAFVLVLTMSAVSFGFLIGQSQQARQAREATEQIQLLSDKVQVSGELVIRGADGLRRLIIK